MQINPRFTFDTVRHDRDNDIHLVLDLVAPKSEWQAKRPPLCIIPVVDRSGSMSGTKLHYAKQSLLKLVEHLSADDYFGLVSFGSVSYVDAKAQKMTAERKEEMKALIGRYDVTGSTNLSSGIVDALKMANEMDLPESTLVRVIVFTDGQPTHGVTTQAGLCQLITKQMGRASVSTFGYGQDACQELLQEMSDSGKGNFAFVKDPDSALAAFGKELGGLLSTYGQNISVSVTPRNGHQISEVLTDADVEEEVDGQVTIKLPHILSEETINVVLATKLAKQKGAGPRQVNAFDVRVSYQILDENGAMVTKTESVKAKVQFVKEGEEQTHPTRAVDELVARAQLLKTQIAAEEAAKKGDFTGAQSVLRAFQMDSNDRGHKGIADIGGYLGGMYESSVNYAQTSGSRASMRKVMTRGMSSSAMVAEDQAVLLSAGYVTSNAAQAQYEETFAAGGLPVQDDQAQSQGQAQLSGTVQAQPNPQLSGLTQVAPNWLVTPTTTNVPLVQGVIDYGQHDHGQIWNGPLPVGVLNPPASNNPFLIAVEAPEPEPVAPVVKKNTRKKSASSAPKGVKKSRSQRW